MTGEDFILARDAQHDAPATEDRDAVVVETDGNHRPRG